MAGIVIAEAPPSGRRAAFPAAGFHGSPLSVLPRLFGSRRWQPRLDLRIISTGAVSPAPESQ